MQRNDPNPEAPISSSSRAESPGTIHTHGFHPLVRAFCTHADQPAGQASRTCVCPLLLLLLPLVVLLTGFFTGTMFDLGNRVDTTTGWYQDVVTRFETQIAAPAFLIGAGIALLFLCTWLLRHKLFHRRPATAT